MEAEYEYRVDSILYINNKRTPGRVPKGIPYNKAAEFAARYAVDAVVPVYYNPANPQESCLEREAPLSNLTLIIGIVLLSICLGFCCSIGIAILRYIQVEYLL